MSWESSLDTHVWIFNVGRGVAVFVRTGMNHGFLIDTGSSEDFSPSEFIKEYLAPFLDKYEGHCLAQAVHSHPHSDHIAECAKLSERGYTAGLITCPHDKKGTENDERLNWKRIVNPEGTDQLIADYKSLYADRNPPLQTIKHTDKGAVPPNLEYGIYYVRPPKCEELHESDDNAYGNATSIMFYLRYGMNSILLPGDCTPEAMQHVLEEEEGSEKRYTVFSRAITNQHPEWHCKTLDQPPLKSLLGGRGLSILLAPHHGLESGYSPELYEAIKGGKPQLVVISEKEHTSDTDGQIHEIYESEDGAFGLRVEVEGISETHRCLKTFDGYHVLIVFSGAALPKIYAEDTAEKLLEKLGINAMASLAGSRR